MMQTGFAIDDGSAAAAQDAAIAANALALANITGQYIGIAATFATLPVTADSTDGDWAKLTDDDIGTGTAQAPQYPAGGYRYDGSAYTFAFAMGSSDAPITSVSTISLMTNPSTFYELTVDDLPAIAGLYWTSQTGDVFEVHSIVKNIALVFRHDVAGGYFADAAEANNVNANSVTPETETKFSILDQLESYRKPDGTFHFKIVWPLLDIEIEWTQTSNPVTSPVNTVTGFTLISDPNNDPNFLGLALSSSTSTIYDASPAASSWWYALASKVVYSGGLPATQVPQTKTPIVELYVLG